MATPIWFSGSSPDAAFAREDQWRRERTGVLEGDRASRANAEAQSMAAFLNNQSREDQLRERDLSRNWQVQEAASRTGEFARQFDANLAYSRDVLANQSKMDAARLKKFASDTALSGELEAQDYFSKPRQISDVDFGLLSRTTGLPEKKLRPLAEKADAIFAANQAAELNLAFFAAQQKNSADLKVPPISDDPKAAQLNAKALAAAQKQSADLMGKLRKSIEIQAGSIHPLVKFNYENNAWEFTGGGRKSIATPGEHAPIGRPPDTVTGTTPAFFAAPASMPQVGDMGGRYFPPSPQPSPSGAMSKPPFVRQNGIVFQLMPDGSYKPASRR